MNPLGYQATNSYNAVGELTSATDYNGNTINYGYDAISELTSKTWVGGNYTATYSYNAAGEMTGASDPYSTYTYTYSSFAATEDWNRTELSNLRVILCVNRKEQCRGVLYSKTWWEHPGSFGMFRPRDPAWSFADGRPGLFRHLAVFQEDRPQLAVAA
jgi:YD repeat-containing protein